MVFSGHPRSLRREGGIDSVTRPAPAPLHPFHDSRDFLAAQLGGAANVSQRRHRIQSTCGNSLDIVSLFKCPTTYMYQNAVKKTSLFLSFFYYCTPSNFHNRSMYPFVGLRHKARNARISGIEKKNRYA
jgi:hypothetical protein